MTRRPTPSVSTVAPPVASRQFRCPYPPLNHKDRQKRPNCSKRSGNIFRTGLMGHATCTVSQTGPASGKPPGRALTSGDRTAMRSAFRGSYAWNPRASQCDGHCARAGRGCRRPAWDRQSARASAQLQLRGQDRVSPQAVEHVGRPSTARVHTVLRVDSLLLRFRTETAQQSSRSAVVRPRH
jgi:hypothetical protein